MENLFKESDFSLFSQYKGKTQSQAPEAQTLLRNLYDKLGKIIDGLRGLNYHCEITRNPLMQGGPGTMKYAEYHWARIYPQQQDVYNDCKDKIFFVVGTAEDGVNVHIDSYSSKGYTCNDAADLIKYNTWCEITPQDASRYSCDEYVKMVDKYIKENWKHFNLFGKEFNIIECIKKLNQMEIDNIKKLLLGNYNLILTGAPGTGKTYLAKKIAEAIGANKDTIKMVQFHPSYDYTDFVEGLRPIKEGDSLWFQRKDGVFKAFCKNAILNSNDVELDDEKLKNLFENEYKRAYEEIKDGKLTEIPIGNGKTKKTFCGDNGQWGLTTGLERKNGKPGDLSYLNSVLKYVNSRMFSNENCSPFENMRDIIGGNTTDIKYVIQFLYDRISEKEKIKNPIPYVFIIDEINRGEASKIFGELFYAIDPGYRGKKGKVDTQYQNLIPKEGDADFDPNKADVFRNGFYVPENVYIIGTMNDIDRSVESMDFAMRRRFAWKEITAESRQSMLDEDEVWGTEGKPSEEVIAKMKVRMDNLNAAIIDKYGSQTLNNKEKIGLTKAYQIGAAYFLKYALYNNFEDLWNNHLEGLLREYLRGKTNIKEKIERLHQAYNDTTKH